MFNVGTVVPLLADSAWKWPSRSYIQVSQTELQWLPVFYKFFYHLHWATTRGVTKRCRRSWPILHLGFQTELQWLPVFYKFFYHLHWATTGGLQRDVVYISLLTNGALVYEPKCGGSGELRCLSQWVQLYTGAQINIGNLSPYLTYGYNLRRLKKKILRQKNKEFHPAQDIFKFN